MRQITAQSFSIWMAEKINSVHYANTESMELAFENLKITKNELDNTPK